ncbi:ABC transporter substrate-binding protein [Helicobacter mustelae]|uniref:metal ABC transporter solute-binding protein, Zn/Mn family n=1 Tax=Helicobacter mustelae TaxID=217 RepID=UPI000DFE774C|nr:zinc ABC transporter substrate-binding protein [Helicobacter mustelae]STP12616.1 ABC transporter substrate-binding protein [Helicobacter mustelae]
MKKILSIWMVLFGFVLAQVKVAVSIQPQEFFVQKIGGDLVQTYVLVPPSKNPENYEPLISQMKSLKDAQLYLGIGMDFEERWKMRFASANPKMEFVNLAAMQEEFPHEDSHDEKDHHDEDRHDVHVWMSMEFAFKQAEKITELLSAKDPKNAAIYHKNLESFLQELKNLDQKIKQIFAQKGVKKEFLVFHPAFEYLAKEYDLTEWAVEEHNKEAKIKHLQKINRIIKTQDLKVIYMQPQFSQRQVELLAKTHHLKISTLDPFARQWDKNLLDIVEKIAYQK